MLAELRLVLQLALGCVFLLAVAGKLGDPGAFARGVVRYGILPERLGFAFGLLLLPVEAFLAVAHLTGWGLGLAAPLGIATLASFGLAVGVNLRRGGGLPCFCFGSGSDETLSLRSLVRLLLLLAAESLVAAGLATDGGLVHPGRLATVSEAIHAGAATVLLLLSASWLLKAGDIVELFRACTTCGGGAVRLGRGR